ncbi:MAG: peptide ABC transporter substrate-binding protein [Clostridia bacterium]|nr:peptide ABC transporter substrate-binding protein [Clostridia bacterium]
MRKSILIILIVIVGIIMSSCCASGGIEKKQNRHITDIYKDDKDDVMDSGPVKRGTLKLFSTYPDTLNPILTKSSFVQSHMRFVFESLYKLDRSQKPVPVLVDKWEVSPDGLIWTFYMKDNIFWHDNMPFSSEDVEFTMSTILNAAFDSVYRKNLENVATYASIDRKTLRITLRQANSFTAEVMTFPIIPKHYFLGEDMLNSSRNMKPVGTGPYRFLEYKERNFIKLLMNENWWNSKNHKGDTPDFPYIHDVEIKLYESMRESINAFQTRDVDTAFIQSGDCGKYSGRSDLSIKKYTSNNFDFIAFNLSKTVLADKTVRQAIAQAINKAELIEDVMPGEAIAADIPVIPDTWLYDTNILYYTPSASKARELLEKNGWMENGDILYKNINGINTPLSFEMLVNDDNDTRCKIALKISEQLKAAGISLQVRKMPWNEEQRLIAERKFDMVLIGSTTTSVPDISFLYSSGGISSGRNIAGYSNPAVDEYLQKLFSENNSSVKKALFINMKSIICDEVPYVGLYFRNNAVLYSKKLRGELSPYVWDVFNDITKWYIPIG